MASSKAVELKLHTVSLKDARHKTQVARYRDQDARQDKPASPNQEPRTKNQEPRTKNQEPRTKNQELLTLSRIFELFHFLCISIPHHPVSESFEIKLPQFEGPFDLLLFFIERDELDIHDIPIATITNDFMEYMHQMQSMNIELASEFILVAATLMRIKAKMLLPRYEKDEEGNEIDPRQDLVRQLLDYKQFKAASEDLRAMEDERMMRFSRGNIQQELSKMATSNEAGYSGELNQLTLYKLIATFEKVMTRFEDNQNRVVHTIVQSKYTIDGQKDYIRNRFSKKPQQNFADLFEDCTTKLHAVYTFLALLELLQNRVYLIFLNEGFNNFVVCTPESAPEQPATEENAD